MFLHKVFVLNQAKAICIPQALAREFELSKGDYVLVKGVKEGILISKVIEGTDATRVFTPGHDQRAKVRR
jgi:antitoxin component of MazEF toxin-antitoxin module